MKGRLRFTIVLMCVLGLVAFGLFGCKKKGASPGPGDDMMSATPVPTPMPTPTPYQYGDEINEATELYGSDNEEMVAMEDINFDYDSYMLSQEARRILADNAIYLKRNKSVNILIEGHCDERGTVEYNIALGQKRADATKDYLASMGIDSSRMSTVSYGEEKPLDPGSDEYAWAKNRRAHFVTTSR